MMTIDRATITPSVTPTAMIIVWDISVLDAAIDEDANKYTPKHTDTYMDIHFEPGM